MKHPIISADGHIDFPCMPANIFVENAPARLRDRMPRVVEQEGRRVWLAHNGTRMGLYGGMGSAGRRYEPGQIHRSDRMAETGLFEDQARGVMRTTIPELRIKDQDLDGVAGEVIYGILGAASRVDDPEVGLEMSRIYNDFAAEFKRSAPERFAMLACLPVGSADEAAAELLRCASLGLSGVELPLTEDLALWQKAWEPLWATAEEVGLPVHVHTIGGRTGTRLPRDPVDYLKWLATYMTDFQMSMARHIAAILFSGALERHPGLRVVIAEAGLGWLPYILERMDYEWEDQFQNLELKMKPSEYWHRQMFVTFQQDQSGLELLDKIGTDNVMWGSDFPHPDGIWPDSRKFIQEQFSTLSERDRRKIVYENAAMLYRFPIQD